jgi:hypothetical protein
LGNRIPTLLDGVLVPALLAVPDHNVGEIVRRYYNLGNHIPVPLDGVLVPAPLPVPDHNIGEILTHGLGEIIALTIIFFVETRFPELLVVDSAACGCASFDSIMLAVFHSSMLGILIGCLSFVVARWMRWV